MGTMSTKQGQNEHAKRIIGRFNRIELRSRDKDQLIELVFSMNNDLKQLWEQFDEQLKINQAQAERIRVLEAKAKRHSKYGGYDKSKPWVFKLCFILERNARPMTLKDIKTEFLLLEPDLNERWANPDHYLSQVLLIATSRKAVIKEKSTRERGYYYRLP
jgi:hypothetical protein